MNASKCTDAQKKFIIKQGEEDTTVAEVCRILKRNGLNRLLRGTRMRKMHTKRYQKQVPGHHIQVDVKFLTFKGKRGEKVRRFQYTAIDDATRVRALKIYDKHTQANAIDLRYS